MIGIFVAQFTKNLSSVSMLDQKKANNVEFYFSTKSTALRKLSENISAILVSQNLRTETLSIDSMEKYYVFD